MDVFVCNIWQLIILMQRINFTELQSQTPPDPIIYSGQIVGLSLKSAVYFQSWARVALF